STRMDLGSMPPIASRLLDRSGWKEVKSKAMVPVVELDGRVLSFLDLFLVNCERLSRATGTSCPALLLVSEANAGEIESYVESRGASGLTVMSFRQSLDRQIVATAEDVERAGKNFASDADAESALAISRAFAGHSLDVRKPAGHGEFLHQLISSGTLGRLLERGVRYVSIRNIDNVGATLDADWLAILGRMIATQRLFTLEVSRRPDGPAGKGGALILRPGGRFQIAEDPSFAGTGVSARDSYYINDATAILDVGLLFRIYETSAAEIRSASAAGLAAVADRGRGKFPPLLDVKPVRLSSGRIAGAFIRETNLWESTGVVEGEGVDALGVLSVKDVEEGFEARSADEQRELAERVRFLATKKWEDYEGVNARLVPHLARRVVSGRLVEEA
ncbi:MAG: UTP--glucose-1-phosphate uridylyltransferase, partial [Candidatus Binatia bacterium]